MKAHDRIEMNSEIMFGKPVIRDTRITVELILRKLGGGMTAEEIIQDHPHLTVADDETGRSLRGRRGRLAGHYSDCEVLLNAQAS